MKGKIIAVIVIMLAIGGCLVGALYYMENQDAFYYTKVDNNRIQELPSDEDMKYEYTLDCYGKSGNKRELKFKTSRKLKEGAFLSLEVRSFGVHKWQEIQYNDIPQKVKEKIK